MKTIIQINGKDVEITLTKEQVAKINKDNRTIQEKIQTPEDALKELGESDEDVIQYRKLQSIYGLAEYILNHQLAIIIIKALNEGWIGDWGNSNEYKYFIWWNMDKKALSYDRCDYWGSYSLTSARLCLKNKELCKYIGGSENFIPVFKSFMQQ